MSWDKAERRARAGKLRAQGTSDNPRDRAGCIATLRDESGRTVTLHRNGLRLDALRAVADWCDATPGDWRVVSYSTPETIAGDLTDRRMVEAGDRSGREDAITPMSIAYPEVAALGKIGRTDLIAPEHLAHVDTDGRLRKRQRRGLE